PLTHHSASFSRIRFSRSFLYTLLLFNDPATTQIYTLSLHDALPIFAGTRPQRRDHEATGHVACQRGRAPAGQRRAGGAGGSGSRDRKSTRLNSSHEWISYAVFCLKKKKRKEKANTAVVNEQNLEQ